MILKEDQKNRNIKTQGRNGQKTVSNNVTAGDESRIWKGWVRKKGQNMS